MVYLLVSTASQSFVPDIVEEQWRKTRVATRLGWYLLLGGCHMED